MDAAVGDLFGELDRLQQLQGRAAALLGGVDTLHRLDRFTTSATFAALRRRAEAAEAERDALRARLAALEGEFAARFAAAGHPHEGARPGRST
jgi:hypothetical protein